MEELRALASTQDGQFATAQALDLDLTPAGLRAVRRRGEITSLRRGVSRFAGAPGDPDPAVTAYLAAWPHAVVSHASAAVHHGLRRVAEPDLPHLTVQFGVPCEPSGVVVHRTRSLPKIDITEVGGVRYTGLARTVCDLADADDPWETLSLVDDAVAAGARAGWIHKTACRLVNGRAGLALVREATAPQAARAFRSWLERAAGHVYRLAHLPDPQWNVRIDDRDGLIGIVDALWPNWRVVAEKEGLRFHTTPTQRRKDAKRFNRLREAGYDPRRFSWEDVVHDPVAVAVTVGRALQAAGAPVDLAAVPTHIEVPDRPFL